MSMPGNNMSSPEQVESLSSRRLSWGGAIGGGILIALSLIFIFGGLELGLGSPLRLGTGAFPFLTGLLLTGLALAICLQELKGSGRAVQPDWLGFLAICAALAVFAGLADRAGLVPAAFFTVIVASLPDRSLPLAGKAALGVGVSLACWGLFIEVLNLPFRAFAVF